MYQVTYTLKSKLLGDRVAEEVTITANVDDYESIEGELSTLRDHAFKNSASEEFYQEILRRTRTANSDLQGAQMAINEMRKEWEKMAKFMIAQGLMKEMPRSPLGDESDYMHPALEASTHISGINDF